MLPRTGFEGEIEGLPRGDFRSRNIGPRQAIIAAFEGVLWDVFSDFSPITVPDCEW